MNVLEVFVASMMLAVIAGCTVEPSVNTEGSIKFASQPDGGGKACGIPTKFPDPPARPGTAYEVSMDSNIYGCDNDRYNYVRFENVPSATKFILRSDICSDPNNKEWTFWLTTYIHPTTTGWIYFGDLASASEGEIVSRGGAARQKRSKWSG
ncbi:hypothetical protein D3C81_176120 [compost metagenome]